MSVNKCRQNVFRKDKNIGIHQEKMAVLVQISDYIVNLGTPAEMILWDAVEIIYSTEFQSKILSNILTEISFNQLPHDNNLNI